MLTIYVDQQDALAREKLAWEAEHAAAYAELEHQQRQLQQQRESTERQCQLQRYGRS